MPRIHLTDVTIANLKSETQTRWMDFNLKGFGLVVGKRRKTFIVIQGKDRKLTTLGHYPQTSLRTARAAALRIIDGTNQPIGATLSECIELYLRTLQASPRWIKEQERLLRHFNTLPDRLQSLQTKEILQVVDSLHSTPSEQLHAFKAIRAALNFAHARSDIPLFLRLPPMYATQEEADTAKAARLI